jgi:hypothetical protein
VITNHAELKRVRNAWGGSLPDFDAAATVLDAATCHADVRIGLTNPPYGLSNRGGGIEWHISLGGALMLKYKLDEDLAAGTADVEIVP